jgi:prepilin-type N-terminal cleavage/methylation domain-containing protein
MRRAAFTLIELLVVMVVILILIGILIPTISMIGRQAKDAQCTSNLQQLGIGITAFQQANNNFFPRA